MGLQPTTGPTVNGLTLDDVLIMLEGQNSMMNTSAPVPPQNTYNRPTPPPPDTSFMGKFGTGAQQYGQRTTSPNVGQGLGQIAGAGAGYALGGPVGGMVGAEIGSAAGSAIGADEEKTEAERAAEKKARYSQKAAKYFIEPEGRTGESWNAISRHPTAARVAPRLTYAAVNKGKMPSQEEVQDMRQPGPSGTYAQANKRLQQQMTMERAMELAPLMALLAL